MASVPILSTGRDTAVYLDNSQVNRSAEKLNSEILGTEKLKLNKALQDKDAFLKMMDVDPVTLISQGATKLQAERYAEFNDKWAKEMQKTKGQLSMDKEIEMRQDRIALEGWQKRMGANQQRYLQELQMYRSNPTKYDEGAFKEAAAQLYSTGEYETGLQPRDGRLFKALDDDVTAWYRSKPSDQFVQAKGKDGKIVTTTATGSTEIGRQRALNLILSDEGYVQDVVRDFWANATDEEKTKYFDTDNDGKVTREEVELAQNFGGTVADIAKNPIMQWGLDKYSQRYRRTDDTTSNPMASSGGSPTQTAIPEARTTPYLISNQTTSSEFYDTYVKKTDGIPFMLTGNALMVTKANLDKGIKGGDEKELPTGSRSFNGDIVGYAKDKDMVVIRPTSGKGAPDTADLILAPRAELDKTITDGVKIKVNGKVMTINEAAGLGGSAAKKAKPY